MIISNAIFVHRKHTKNLSHFRRRTFELVLGENRLFSGIPFPLSYNLFYCRSHFTALISSSKFPRLSLANDDAQKVVTFSVTRRCVSESGALRDTERVRPGLSE